MFQGLLVLFSFNNGFHETRAGTACIENLYRKRDFFTILFSTSCERGCARIFFENVLAMANGENACFSSNNSVKIFAFGYQCIAGYGAKVTT